MIRFACVRIYTASERRSLHPDLIPLATLLSGGVFEEGAMVEGTITYIFDREETNKDNWWVPCTETTVRTPQNLTNAIKSHRGIPFASTVSPPLYTGRFRSWIQSLGEEITTGEELLWNTSTKQRSPVL